jgi:hypothetical protein
MGVVTAVLTWLKKTPGWLKERPRWFWNRWKPVTDTDPLFDADGLDSATTWTAAGFTALTAVLTFFGIKEGILDRLLRANQTAALWIFILIGLGLVLGLATPALKKDVRMPAFPLVLALLVLTLLTLHFLPNVEGEKKDSATNTLALGVLVFLGAAALALLFIKAHLPLVVAVLAVAVTATSMGLYGAAKLSVLSTTFTGDSRVTAALEKNDSGEQVKVGVLANRTENKILELDVFGVVGDPNSSGEGLIGRARLAPDDAGAIDASLVFPVAASQWDWISVRACDPPQCASSAERVGLSGGRGSGQLLGISGTLSRGAPDAGINASLVADHVPGGCTVVALVYRLPAAGEPVLAYTASLRPDAAGAATWTPANLPGSTGERLSLRFLVSASPGGKSCAVIQPEQEVASLAL